MKRRTQGNRFVLNGFSLLELLVAIAVVSLLAALIFGVSKNLQTSSRNAKCLSNLRQIGVGAIGYLSDNNGRLFPTRDWYWPSSGPYVAKGLEGFLDYMGIPNPPPGVSPEKLQGTILTCPELKSMFPGLGRCYSINKYAIRYNPYPSVPGAKEPMLPGNLLKIERKAKMMMFTDGVKIPGDDFVYSNITSDYYSKLHAPHSNKQNVLFFDGHVESVDKAMFAPPDTSDFWGRILQ